MKDREILELYERDYRPFGKTIKDLGEDIGKSWRATKRSLAKARREKGNDPEEDNVVTPLGSNQVVISSKEINTLDELLKHTGFSLDDWVVTKVVTNKWDGYRSGKKANLTWDNGKVSGMVNDSGEIITKPLIQIKAWLTKKELVEVRPSIKPIYFKSSPRKAKNKSVGSPHVDLVLFDPHFGFSRSLRTNKLNSFHDREALSIALHVASEIKPDRVIWGGDVYDFPDWSDKFIRSPEMNNLMQPAIYEFSWWLDKFNKVTSKQVVLEGNHEERMTRALYTHMSHVFDLRSMDGLKIREYPSMSVPGLNGFEEMGIEWVGGYPDNKYWIHDDLAVIHGNNASSVPGANAAKVLKDRTYSILFGHIHRHESATNRILEKDRVKRVFSATPGMLGKIDRSIPGQKETHLWNQGFYLVTHDGKNTTHSVEHIVIDNGYGYFRGHKIEGLSLKDEIENVEGVGF